MLGSRGLPCRERRCRVTGVRTHRSAPPSNSVAGRVPAEAVCEVVQGAVQGRRRAVARQGGHTHTPHTSYRQTCLHIMSVWTNICSIRRAHIHIHTHTREAYTCSTRPWSGLGTDSRLWGPLVNLCSHGAPGAVPWGRECCRSCIVIRLDLDQVLPGAGDSGGCLRSGGR